MQVSWFAMTVALRIPKRELDPYQLRWLTLLFFIRDWRQLDPAGEKAPYGQHMSNYSRKVLYKVLDPWQ